MDGGGRTLAKHPRFRLQFSARLKYQLIVHLPTPIRVALGLGGVAIVAAAVAGALGLCSWAGMRSTLIIAEVIPFLALAGARCCCCCAWLQLHVLLVSA